MADTDSDPIKEFQSSLNELAFNSKPQINMLTMLSEDYKDTKAPAIVRCIEKRLHSVATEKKLPILYLMDSICKNVGQPYITLFTQNLVSNFCLVFGNGDEKTRLSLYKLRQSWSHPKPIFPEAKLHGLDTRVKTLDPAWPVTAKVKAAEAREAKERNSKPDLKSVVKQPNSVAKPIAVPKPIAGQPKSQLNPIATKQSGVHINPKFLNEKIPKALPADPQSAELAKQLIQKQNELLQIQKQKLEYDMMIEKKKLEEQARALQEKEMKLKQKEQAMSRAISPNGRKPKKRKRSRSQRSRSPSPPPPKNKQSPNNRWNQSPNKRDIHPNRSPQLTKPTIPAQSHPTVNSSKILPSQGIGGQPPVPTTIPAPTILAQPEMLNISRMDSSVVTTMSSRGPMVASMSAHNSHMNNAIDGNRTFPTYGQDRDYRKELESMMTQADEKLNLGVISPAAHQHLVREISDLRTRKDNTAMTTLVLKEPADTFEMPVDGKFRKLYYLDDTTAVVLLGAPPNMSFDELARRDSRSLEPRQISFEGNPTCVHIDNDRHTGESFFLEFNGKEYVHMPRSNNPSVTQIPQRIKFGGPGKEIILNGQPYPAKFGGPPIQVWFEGDPTGPHTLQLDGPTPRVKLSVDRRFDLWNEVINRASNEAKSVTITPNPPVGTDINNLLSQLIAAGMIDNNKNQSQNSPKATIPSPKREEPDIRERIVSNDPPIKLTSDSLKISRPSVVAALYRGIQCTNCSLRFDDKTAADKTRYSKHLDWHFRQNRRDKAKPNSSAASMRRNWYYPLGLWVQFKEVTDEEDTSGLFQNDDNEAEEQEVVPNPTVTAEKDDSLNSCPVCGEKFDQKWCVEEEEWTLQNAVKHTDNRIYHPLCLNDFIAQSQRLEEHLNESVSDSDMKVSVSEESTEKSDNKEEAMETDVKTEDSEPPIETTEPNVETKSEDTKETDATEPIVSDQKQEVEETSEVANGEEEPEEDAIKVFELEIPINSDNELKPDLSDILESKEVVDGVEHPVEAKEAPEEVVKSEEKVVLQTGGIVIKMKASNLQTAAAAAPVETQESEQTSRSEVIVRGEELSSLCTIL